MYFVLIILIFFFLYRTAFRETNDGDPILNGESVSDETLKENEILSSEVLVGVVKMMGVVMMADGALRKSELAEVKSYLADNYSSDTAKKMLKSLEHFLKNKTKTKDIRPYCLLINQYMSYKQRLTLLSTLFKIAVADSCIEDSEAIVIEMYARFACIRDVDFNRYRGYFAYGFSWKNTGRQQSQRNYKSQKDDDYYDSRRHESQWQERGSEPKSDCSSNDTKWAYRELGLSEGASEKEIKSAYRKLSMQYHPDRQMDASDEELRVSTEKFQRINEAYEVLVK